MIRGVNGRGFSLAEIAVVVAVIGVVMALSAPFFVTYWQSATLKAGAEELVTVLNGARQLALNQNQTVCVTNNGTTVVYHLGNCAAAPWTGLGTEADGSIRLANAVQVSAATASATFNYLGAGGGGATYTVLHPTTGRALCVAVAPSGRVTIAAPANQPVCP